MCAVANVFSATTQRWLMDNSALDMHTYHLGVCLQLYSSSACMGWSTEVGMPLGFVAVVCVRHLVRGW